MRSYGRVTRSVQVPENGELAQSCVASACYSLSFYSVTLCKQRCVLRDPFDDGALGQTGASRGTFRNAARARARVYVVSR